MKPFHAWVLVTLRSLLLAGLVTGCLAGARAAVGGDMPWFHRCLVGMEIDPTGAEFGIGASDTNYAAKYDGREVARRCKEAGGEYFLIWARDGEYTYYDSKLQPKAPGLGRRDVLREAVEEGHKLGLTVIAYCVQQYCSQTLREHPEWRMAGSDGKPFGRVCFRSGYLGYMKEMVAEQLAYGVDGLVLDMMDQGFVPPYGCWCATCQAEFQAQCGRPMPRHESWDEDWDRVLEFRYASSDRFEKDLTEHIRRLNPRATVYFNYHGVPPFSWQCGQRPVQHAINGDFVSGETGLWAFSALTVGLNAEFYRAVTPGRPIQAAIQRGVRGYFDQTTRPLNDLRWELLTLLAHGAFVTVIDKVAYDGSLDPVAYERFGLLFKEAHAKRGHFGQSPAPEVGIYFSSRTRDWQGRDYPADYFMAFLGAQKAMVYEHIPWGVLQEENLTREGLRQFPVVLLANAAILSEREVHLFRDYVEAGGKLIVTGTSGTLDRLGRKQGESSLADLIGAKLKGRLLSQDNWVKFAEAQNETSREGTQGAQRPGVRSQDPPSSGDGLRRGKARSKEQMRLGGDIRPDWPFLVKGPAVIYEPGTAAVVGDLFKPERLASQQGVENPDFLLSAGERVGPAILVNRLGRGTVLTFATSPDYATASELHIPESRKLLRYAVRFLNPEPLVEITAPTTVEAVVTDDSAQRILRVHLLGYNAPPQTTPATDAPYVLPGLIEDAPIYRAAITVNRPIRRATVLNRSTMLRRHGSRLELMVQDMHEVVLVRY